jgi:putative membrane protein
MAALWIATPTLRIEAAAPGPAESGATIAHQAHAEWDDGHMGWDGGGWWLMAGMMFLFWFGVLAIAAWAVATYARRSPETRGESSLDIARRRYARGEITREEFERLMRDLG